MFLYSILRKNVSRTHIFQGTRQGFNYRSEPCNSCDRLNNDYAHVAAVNAIVTNIISKVILKRMKHFFEISWHPRLVKAALGLLGSLPLKHSIIPDN